LGRVVDQIMGQGVCIHGVWGKEHPALGKALSHGHHVRIFERFCLFCWLQFFLFA
jgi:hypothetical protein